VKTRWRLTQVWSWRSLTVSVAVVSAASRILQASAIWDPINRVEG